MDRVPPADALDRLIEKVGAEKLVGLTVQAEATLEGPKLYEVQQYDEEADAYQ